MRNEDKHSGIEMPALFPCLGSALQDCHGLSQVQKPILEQATRNKYQRKFGLAADPRAHDKSGVNQTVETPPDAVQTVTETTRNGRPISEKQRKAWFTTENARQMNARAMELRKARIQALRDAANPKPRTDDEYRRQELAHTREEIEACRNAMQSLRNGPARDYKAMSDALWRLREIERHLAGWPGPGNIQPRRQASVPIPATIDPL